MHVCRRFHVNPEEKEHGHKRSKRALGSLLKNRAVADQRNACTSRKDRFGDAAARRAFAKSLGLPVCSNSLRSSLSSLSHSRWTSAKASRLTLSSKSEVRLHSKPTPFLSQTYSFVICSGGGGVPISVATLGHRRLLSAPAQSTVLSVRSWCARVPASLHAIAPSTVGSQQLRRTMPIVQLGLRTPCVPMTQATPSAT
eukprot:6212453-Pleurochrysis_carterae.AAC.3